MLIHYPQKNNTPLDPIPGLKHRKFITMLKMCGSFTLAFIFFGAMLFSGSLIYLVPMLISLGMMIRALELTEELEEKIVDVQETLDSLAEKTLPRDERE
jgi:hypothetical protein